jgi:transcriptional antiterminator RfaH
VAAVIMSGSEPARLNDHIVDEIKARERSGLVVLPKRAAFHTGETVRVAHGPFAGHLALYAEQRPRERVLVLLALLGSQQRVELAKDDIEAVGRP